MKKSVSLLLLLLVSCLTACSQKAPKCSDSNVKALVVNTSKELVEKKMIKNMLEKDTVGFIGNLNKDDPNDQKMSAMLIYGRIPELSDLKMSKSPKIMEFVKDIETKCSNLKVKSIRTSSKDDTAKKCNCEADIVESDTKLPVRYEAQKTDDGKIRVEVSM